MRLPTVTGSDAVCTSSLRVAGHYHTANEEAIYVLAGSGILRHDGETYEFDAGSYATFSTGESGGHRVTTDTEDVLRYLMFRR